VTTYPSTGDYTLALQNPDTAFASADLRTAVFSQGSLGPYGISGSSAVVFNAKIEDSQYALRCYTREDASTPERYAALESYVAANKLSKYVGTVTWYKEEVRVKGGRWPVLKMEWIAGQQLNEYASYLADSGNNAALRTLSGRWLELINDLQRASFAHGDLQHGNVLVDRQGQLRLVDFDSVWIPPLQGQAAPTESGHPSYQPQAGAAQSRWGPFMDTFSALVIYLALTALAADPGLWPKFNNGDNLLFERNDFAPPFETDVWKHLRALGNADVDSITGTLRDCCAHGWAASKNVQDMLRPKWWDRVNASPPTGTGPVTATPSAPSVPLPSATPTAPQITFNPLEWYKPPAPGKPTVPSQPAAPAGSLPPPPTAPYQSTVAPQSTATRPGSTWQHNSSGPTGRGGSWWAQQPAPKPPQPPAKPKQGQPAAAYGTLLIAAGAFIFIVLAVAAHAPLPGILLGLLLAIPGIALISSKSHKPPGSPPSSGTGWPRP
jgi:eukaryotic-like serine/threonine-protein kinase